MSNRESKIKNASLNETYIFVHFCVAGKFYSNKVIGHKIEIEKKIGKLAFVY